MAIGAVVAFLAILLAISSPNGHLSNPSPDNLYGDTTGVEAPVAPKPVAPPADPTPGRAPVVAAEPVVKDYTAANYPGVFGADHNFRTPEVCPFERRVHDALHAELDAHPYPAVAEDDPEAQDRIDKACVARVAKRMGLKPSTVEDIDFKVVSWDAEHGNFTSRP